jgi:NADH-quinone oxidoreductase subunit H
VADFFHLDLGLWPGVAKTLAALIQCALLLNVVAVGALVFIWMERKVSGRIQDRLGPTRVGGKFGWLQTLADGLKLITKEDLVPAEADSFLFKAAPYISFCSSFAAYMALPFSSGWVGLPINTAVFFIVAVIGLEVFGVILAGYASGSKWSLFGGMREAAQVVSYEVPLGLCVVIPVVIAGTMDLVAIGDMQAGLFTNWFLFHDPFTFITFFVYATCATASVNRAPFDLAEAESELVAGFHTEYSGLRWSIFFMAEYGSMFAVSMLASILFLGGWNGPIPITSMLGLTDVGQPAAIGAALSSDYLFGPDWGPRIAGYLGRLLGMTNLVFKACLGVTVMMWVRWTLPRLRIDQVITTCLKYCTPIAAVMFVGVCLWKVGGFPFLNNLAPQYDPIEVRESYMRPKRSQPTETRETAAKDASPVKEVAAKEVAAKEVAAKEVATAKQIEAVQAKTVAN